MAESQASDLIILCSRGRTGVTRWMLGSVAQKVVRQSPVPVLVLNEHAPSNSSRISLPGACTVRRVAVLRGSA
jgi:hypothetical protein